jgi:hypothetical protein
LIPGGYSEGHNGQDIRHYAPADFMVMDMEEEDDSLIILGRPLLNTTNAVIYIGSRQIHF